MNEIAIFIIFIFIITGICATISKYIDYENKRKN